MLITLALAAHCLPWSPGDVRAMALLLGPKLAPDTVAVAIADERLCARLASAVGAPGVPVYAARFGCYFVVTPQWPGALADDLYVLDERYRLVRDRPSRARRCASTRAV